MATVVPTALPCESMPQRSTEMLPLLPASVIATRLGAATCCSDVPPASTVHPQPHWVLLDAFAQLLLLGDLVIVTLPPRLMASDRA